LPTALFNFTTPLGSIYILFFARAQAAAAANMSNQQQAMIIETALALKRAVKRRAYG
jgi:hypothetical protein